ncbi:hypothetical protein HY636_02810 [Candidatus Woesearchaeota archaeon]|nr:hypothetical protein [Candidatus Woesearchaeota archaeon]
MALMALETAFTTLSAYFQLVLIILIIYEIVKLFGSLGEGGREEAAAATAHRAETTTHAAAAAGRGEAAELTKTEKILLVIDNFVVDINHTLESSDGAPSVRSMERILTDLKKIIPLIRMLDAEEKIVKNDEGMFEELIPDPSLRAEIGEEANLTKVLETLITRFEAAVSGRQLSEAHAIIERIHAVARRLIQLNEDALKRVRRDVSR